MMLTLAKLEHKLRPMLSSLLPPKFFMEMYSSKRQDFIKALANAVNKPVNNAHHEVNVCGVNFRNDLGNAAGLDKDGSLLEFNYCIGAGFAVVGTVLNKPHTGNIVKIRGKEYNPWVPLPNTHSALNSLGLPSLGVDKSLENIDKFRQKYPDKKFPIGLSIMGHPLQQGQEKLDGILECVEKAIGKVEFIEINESCPNVKYHSDDGLEKRLKAVTALKKETPIFVKLGSLGNAENNVRLLDNCSVDGLVLLNTQKDYDHYRPKLVGADRKVFDFYTKEFEGGLSGEIIRDLSFDSVKQAAAAIKEQNSKLQLIHVGGINSAADVVESRQHAPLREWYTGMMEHICSKPLNSVYKDMVNK